MKIKEQIMNMKILKEKYPDLYEKLLEFEENKPLKLFLENLKAENEIELVLEAITLSDNEFDENHIKNLDFFRSQKFVKIYRNLCKKNVEKEIFNECLRDNEKYIEESLSNIKDISSIFSYEKDYNNIRSLFFDYLSNREKFILYNIPYENNLDKKYLNHLINNNNKQNIELICIIDRFNYSQYIDSITYPYITSLNFVLISAKNSNVKFMYYHLPINNIYNIFINYFITIKFMKILKKYHLVMNFL